MSESQFSSTRHNNNNLMTMESRAERMARYKEERRRQLAAQYSTQIESPKAKPPDKGSNSSSESGPRTTRASRLRAAATNAQDNSSSPAQATKVDLPLQRPQQSPQDKNSRLLERDKSSKRKSNLNRSLTSEEVPNLDLSDIRNRRRRRRFFTPDVSEQSIRDSNESKSDTNLTASTLSQSSTSPITATTPTPRTVTVTTTPKKSELRIHMENARKGITPSYSEMGKYKSPITTTTTIRRPITSSPKERQRIYNSDDAHDLKSSSNKENLLLKNKNKATCSDGDVKTNSRNIAKRMEELTALTRETLARVERLKTKPSPTRSVPSSILKKKFDEHEAGPVSILKRKVSQEDQAGPSSSTHTPPVTFSPSVVEPATTNRKQGILKKRRSLDESQVMRHRSCSPDVANKLDSRSILKNQRRSSLEELTRTQSPEHLHGILKRKTSRNEDVDESLSSPQGILKRKSGASSASSTGSTPHVSITTAVILAAAGGAEMVLDDEHVRPILKKKSFSDEHPSESSTETPKPILKKKSSTETDDTSDDRPRPILKITRTSLDKETSSDTDCDFKPILKQEWPSKPRLSFCGDSPNDDVVLRRNSRRSNTICTEFNLNGLKTEKDEDRELKKPRPLSVSELVMSFENTLFSTGAIPKRTNLNRNSDRYRTQPVTSNELEASLSLVRGPQLDEKVSTTSVNHTIGSLFDFTSSLEDDRSLNSFLSSSLQQNSPDSGGGAKMSSDSAFQSLGDGLELEQEEMEERPPLRPTKLEPNKLELQMKAIAEEAKKMRLGRGSSGVQKYRNRRNGSESTERLNANRFATQPVTFDEVQSACKLNKNSDDSGEQEDEPSRLSISERIRLFNNVVPKRDSTTRRRCTRFQTHPVTSNEVENARCIPTMYALDEQDSEKVSSERRGILKSSSNRYFQYQRRRESPPPPPRPVLKKRDSFDSSPSRRSILKTEVPDSTYDEGISCNDSGSDSELLPSPKSEMLRKKTTKSSSSDGESSGGREIRSIFKNETNLKVKHALESALLKSKSQSTVWDETETVPSTKRIANIRRSQTQTQTTMPRAIAELQAKLQQQGDTEWKKRVQQNNNSNDELKFLKDKNRYNDEKSILALKKDELDASSKQWKSRVEKSDAEKFSVAGRMDQNKDSHNLSINIPHNDENNKKKPEPKRFKGRESDSSSTPVSPDKHKYIDLSRSLSVPDPNGFSSPGPNLYSQSPARKVSLIKPDDYTFKNFYKSVEESKREEHIDLSLEDFDKIERHSLLVQRKNVQVRKRRGASKNPIKALAQRSDIVSNEYTEVITGVAEREKKRLNIEKLAKNSNLAVEALAGLASKEDFTSVALKKSTLPSAMVPFKDVMLLQVKGRRHVQTRLVEPIPESINEGDNYILITSNCLYNYIGKYSNVIEQSRAADVVNHIQQSGDLGCKVDSVVTINSTTVQGDTERVEKFWKILGGQRQVFIDGGHPNEDEIYEANILSTNMIYGLDDNELVPLDEYWGAIPKIEMLESGKVLVFDFGSEMYVWSGKSAPIDKKKRALKLAKELWDEGYNYTDCSVCPLNVATILGDRPEIEVPLKGKRPEWALFAKLTQHRETILFKEKFLDWPDFSRVIRVKGDDFNERSVDASFDIQACNVNEMIGSAYIEPDLEVEGYHLGRGDQYFDEETKRLFEFKTLDLKSWRILENTCELCERVYEFYDCDSYIIRWSFRMTVKGRELSGKPSKHLQTGRDRCIYFCWQGSNASINEKGYAALLTVELDSEKAPQIRVVQGLEPAAFLKLFNGSMIVYSGKREEPRNPRLFVVRGEVQSEVSLLEVPCQVEQLRSKTSFVLIDNDEEQLLIWHGCKSSKQIRKVAKFAAENFAKNNSLGINEMVEGETNEFFDGIFEETDRYFSLLDSDLCYDYQMRLFHLSSIFGTFEATEILSPRRSEYSSPYPFLQSELYSASQPAIFLIDNHHELWLWQGWWPDTEEKVDLSDQTGSGAVRWQAERRAAMQTAINYWKKNHSGDESIPAYLVWAGLESLEFKNLFPTWTDRDDVAEINLKEGKKEGKLLVEKELALMSRTSYPLSELLQRPLPEGVDPTHLEIYLSPEDFQELLSMTKEEFQKLPSWKQTSIKKEKGLF